MYIVYVMYQVVHVENSRTATDSRDYYKDYSDCSLIPRTLAADRLSIDFRNVSVACSLFRFIFSWPQKRRVALQG